MRKQPLNPAEFTPQPGEKAKAEVEQASLNINKQLAHLDFDGKMEALLASTLTQWVSMGGNKENLTSFLDTWERHFRNNAPVFLSAADIIQQNVTGPH